MTTLTIRRVDPSVRDQLRIRAARNGRSMEAELRHILHDALKHNEPREQNLAVVVQRLFAPWGGVELEPHPPTPIREPPSFEP